MIGRTLTEERLSLQRGRSGEIRCGQPFANSIQQTWVRVVGHFFRGDYLAAQGPLIFRREIV